MGNERKLKMVLPNKGWLVHPARWNIGNILELAGIGKYTSGDNELNFESYDSEIEVETRRARDIPCDTNLFDVGVTGHDLIKEYVLTGSEVLDLECSYVDLAFMTSAEYWKKVLQKWKEVSPTENLSNNVSSLNSLELFLACKMFFLKTEDPALFCHTTYKKIAQGILDKSKEKISKIFSGRKCLDVWAINRKGALEKTVRTSDEEDRSKTDMIFETIATGDSAQKYNLITLENVMNSTARLYVNLHISAGFLEHQDELTMWKYKKYHELKDRIEIVLNDIKKYCQVKIDFYPFYEINTPVGKAISGFLNRGIESIYHYPPNKIRGLESRVSTINFITHKKDLPEIKKFSEKSNSQCFISAMDIFDIQSLYAYCPILPCSLYGDYPCADSSKLRTEHKKRATLFNLEKS